MNEREREREREREKEREREREREWGGRKKERRELKSFAARLCKSRPQEFTSAGSSPPKLLAKLLLLTDYIT